MKNIPDYVDGLSDWSKVMLCLLLSLLLGAADYVTGDFSLSLFYALPIAFASWFIGKKGGFFISIVCSVELYIINVLVAPEAVTIDSIRSWNSLMEISYLVLTGHLFYRVRVEMNQTRQRSVELEAANRELEAFNYTVAHDLRKPLTVVNGYCQAIRELCGHNLGEECTTYLQEAYDGTLRMNRLIDALLDFSRLAHVAPRRERVDLSNLSKEIIEELVKVEPERRVLVRIAEGIEVNGDANLLRVVLGNLLGNAWKYSSQREEAVIEFGVTKVEAKTAFFVRDNGPGFDMADAEKLFVPFQRIAGNAEFAGHGIGLATVERIIRRHGGRVWAEGAPGEGATFYFTL